MPTPTLPLRFATESDTGRIRIANEDAGYASPELGVFVVADGMGGLPAGAAASQLIVHALPNLIGRCMAELGRAARPVAGDGKTKSQDV